MLNLKELSFSGIGRFVKEQTIDFEKLGNFVQVDGVNLNTGGSSGAAKTTVFNALDYLFGINDKPTTVLKSRLTDDGITVQGTFDFDGKSLIITRGKKLVIDIDGEVTKGSSKISEEKLDEILAMPRDLFRKILHKRQKEGGFFLQMTPKDINEFLMNCLGLGHFKKKIDTIDAKIAEVEKSKENVGKDLESAKAALKATKDAIVALGQPPIKDIQQSTILQLKEKMEKSSSNLKLLIEQQKAEMAQLEISRPQIVSSPFDRSQIIQFERELDGLKKNIEDLNQKERLRQNAAIKELSAMKLQKQKLEMAIEKGKKASDESVKTATEIKKIRDQMCPTCEQSWTNEKTKEKELELIKKLKNLKEDIDASNLASQNIGAVNFSIAEYEKESKPQKVEGLDQINQELLSVSAKVAIERQKESEHQAKEAIANRSAQKEFSDKQKVLLESHSLTKNAAAGQADIDSRAFDAAVNKLKSYQEASSRYEKSLASLKAQEASYDQKVVELTKTSTQVDNQLLIVEEIKRAVKSYLSCSFDDALETIGENATKLIRGIPNMANATIQLEGIRETQDGRIKEEVNAVIHMDGEQNVDIRSLSGGERTSTDLAIDLSVIDLIENRTNKGINIFVLDEPFDGLDTVCIEMALEVLKNSSTNKKLIIVDHNPEVKQMVESRLIVTRDGATSTVSQS